MPLSVKQEQEDIRMKVALSLTKHVNWRTKKLERKAYVRIAEELNTFGVSPWYVGHIWRKHNQHILDIVNCDLGKNLKRLTGSGSRRKISVVGLYAKVKAEGSPIPLSQECADLGLQGWHPQVHNP
jgi:hypothetical protein